MGLRVIIEHREILDLIVKNAFRLAQQVQFGIACRLTRQLLFDQFGMVQVQMHIPALPNQFSRLISTLLCEHPDQH